MASKNYNINSNLYVNDGHINQGTNNTITSSTNSNVFGSSNTIISANTSNVLGSYNNVSDYYNHFVVGAGNNVSGSFGTSTFGGSNTSTQSNYSTIIGRSNTLTYYSSYSTIINGNNNSMYYSSSSVVGGRSNTLNISIDSTISGGENNSLTGSSHSFIGGGEGNIIYDFIGGGWNVVGGGYKNKITTTSNAYTNVIAGGGRNHINNTNYTFIGSGQLNTIGDGSSYLTKSSIVGGDGNKIYSTASFIGGGFGNVINSTDYYSSIVGGRFNTISGATSWSSFIGGGAKNVINSKYSSIITGLFNTINGNYSSIGGGSGNTVNDNYSSIVGGKNNSTNGSYTFIGSGKYNQIVSTADPFTAMIVGGQSNTISLGKDTTIVGGVNNGINIGVRGFIGGGGNNYIGDTTDAVIAGGLNNRISGNTSSILGGSGNIITHTNSHIIGSNITSVASNTTHVERFNIGTIDNNESLNDVLVRDTDGTVRYRSSQSIADSFTGNTSGDCITDLYVTNLYGCSPLHIEPSGVNDVYIVENGGGMVGVGTSAPTARLHISGNTRHSGDIFMDNGEYIEWNDNTGIWPTSVDNKIRWRLNNDSAEIYAWQSSSNDIDFVFKLTDDATTSTDNYVFWIDNTLASGGESNDRYPLEMNGSQFIVNALRRYATSPSNSGASKTNFYVLKSGATALSESILHANVITNRVGVNTSSPIETLDVNGNTIISGTLNIGTVDTGSTATEVLVRETNGIVNTVNLSTFTQQKYAASIPFTAATSQTVTHNLNDTDVIVQLKDSTGTLVIPDVVDNYTNNTVDIQVSSTETFRVIIIG